MYFLLFLLQVCSTWSPVLPHCNITTGATAIQLSRGACWQISSKDFIPCKWAKPTKQHASSGSVYDSNNHFSKSPIVCINASTHPTSLQWRIWSHISFTMQQLGHLSLRTSVHLACKPFVATMPMTCLHAQCWNILGTSSRAAETYLRATRCDGQRHLGQSAYMPRMEAEAWCRKSFSPFYQGSR